MPNTLTDPKIALQFYSALCSDVYHHAAKDQWLDLVAITEQLDIKGLGIADVKIDDIDIVALKKLTDAGFTPGTDGFYYTANGFGARLLKDLAGNYTIVFRGTDIGDLGWDGAKAGLIGLAERSLVGLNPCAFGLLPALNQ
jgi:hypothetical protein